MTADDIKSMVVTYFSSVPAERLTPGLIRDTVTMFCRASPASEARETPFIDALTRELEVKFQITMDNAAFIKWIQFEPWLETRRAEVQPYYWNRYRRFLSTTLPPLVLGTLEKDTDKMVGLLEDPRRSGPWRRRGMCVGHVQSGKTANYIGVIAKAADYGYKFIVLLAGLHNSLRHQTQERVEEGFIGIDSDSTAVGRGNTETVTTGVGRIDSTKRPISITSKSSDFRTAAANSMNLSFSAIHEPLVLVIKKQKKILENLTDWLRANNLSEGGVIRGVPMLVIDDEADNASVNTSATNDPTQINRLIRLLLGQFEQNCYVGYTATPFANIFIDPDTDDAMLHEDLFPRNFIVSLEPPANYVGPQRIFLEDGDLQGIIRPVDDFHAAFPLNHKITQRIDELPASLKEAIRSFVLVRTLRILRGATGRHNSMLVNVSRFSAVQQQVTSLIAEYLAELRNAVRNFCALNVNAALQDSSVAALQQTWQREFSKCGFDWDQVQRVLNDAVSPITVRTINYSSADILDYKSHEEGLNVITVGGLSLSRGLTLEGLTVSYFLRNSIMYDTLLQMGRWFGYRDGYADLCRLYMTSDAVSWYGHITEAIDELRAEFLLMEQHQRRPEDFGLKVRAHPDALIVTARNKMRSGKKIAHSVSLSARLIETTAILTSAIAQNRAALESLVRRLDKVSKGISVHSPEGILWRNVASDEVRLFLTAYRNHDDRSMNTQTAPLLRLLDELSQSALRSWDVCLYQLRATGAESTPVRVAGWSIVPESREIRVEEDAFVISGKSRRVASRGAEAAALSVEQRQAAQERFAAAGKGAKSVADLYYRQERERPLLMLHVLRVKATGVVPQDVPAWGISFPGSLPDTARVAYIVNTTWYREHYEADALEEEEDEIVEA